MVIGTTDPVKNKILVVSSIPASLSLIKRMQTTNLIFVFVNLYYLEIVGKEDLSFRPIYSDEIQCTDWAIDNKYPIIINLKSKSSLLLINYF